MALILCLETATTNCSVAIAKDGNIITLREDATAGYSHAEKLHIFIEEVLQEAGLTQESLDAIAVSKGPGSYTGLRIGVSAAKGLCFALDKKLIAIPTLDVLAEQVTDNRTIVPMLDARRMEVYSAVFNAEKKQIRETQAEILDPQSFEDYKAQQITFIGNGVEKYKELCTHEDAQFITHTLPSSKEMAVLAESAFQQQRFEDVAYFVPYYLKDFKAG
jgi:tRNA threonylcarbamoyladenosine biosynthesis protein TsaB